MERIPIIAANWKMHKSGQEAQDFLRKLHQCLEDPAAMILIAPSFTSLLPCALLMNELPYLLLGAQNMHQSDEGAFTGEISASMIKDVGGSFVILGHSERRYLFQETNPIIHLKLKKALEKDLLPILCIGETFEEKENGHTFKVLSHQILSAIGTLPFGEMIIAYEPVWAIGSKKAASGESIEEIHAFCRSVVANLWGKEGAQKTSIIYGGSVTKEIATSLSKYQNIDGVLVGKASLDVDEFLQVIKGFIV